jgi:hypothetical protein
MCVHIHMYKHIYQYSVIYTSIIRTLTYSNPDQQNGYQFVDLQRDKSPHIFICLNIFFNINIGSYISIIITLTYSNPDKHNGYQLVDMRGDKSC